MDSIWPPWEEGKLKVSNKPRSTFRLLTWSLCLNRGQGGWIVRQFCYREVPPIPDPSLTSAPVSPARWSDKYQDCVKSLPGKQVPPLAATLCSPALAWDSWGNFNFLRPIVLIIWEPKRGAQKSSFYFQTTALRNMRWFHGLPFLRITVWDWREGSAVKSVPDFTREPELIS